MTRDLATGGRRGETNHPSRAQKSRNKATGTEEAVARMYFTASGPGGRGAAAPAAAADRPCNHAQWAFGRPRPGGAGPGGQHAFR